MCVCCQMLAVNEGHTCQHTQTERGLPCTHLLHLHLYPKLFSLFYYKHTHAHAHTHTHTLLSICDAVRHNCCYASLLSLQEKESLIHTCFSHPPDSHALRVFCFSFFCQVTMADRSAADRACKDPNPIIDGRKANVNLAYLGAKPRVMQPGKKCTAKYIFTHFNILNKLQKWFHIVFVCLFIYFLSKFAFGYVHIWLFTEHIFQMNKSECMINQCSRFLCSYSVCLGVCSSKQENQVNPSWFWPQGSFVLLVAAGAGTFNEVIRL